MVPTEARWGFPRRPRGSRSRSSGVGRHLAGGPEPRRLVRDYLAAFGPATAADVQTFTGLGAMKTVLKGMGDEARGVPRTTGGRELFDLPGAPRPRPRRAGAAALPARVRQPHAGPLRPHAAAARRNKRKVVTKKPARARHLPVSRGPWPVTWRIERKKKSATLELAPFAELPKRRAEGSLRGEGEGVGALRRRRTRRASR